MKELSKDELWQVTSDLPTELIEIKDAHGNPRGALRMRGLTGAELTEYQKKLTILTRDGKSRTNMHRAMAKLILACACNEDGSPFFDQSDLIKLDSLPAATLMPLFEAAQKLCGLSDNDVKEMTEDFTETES